MKNIKILSLLFLILLSTSCRKNKVLKNQIIQGSVINLYTASPVASIKVVLKSVSGSNGGFFNIVKGNYSQTLTNTTTDANGNFSFNPSHKIALAFFSNAS